MNDNSEEDVVSTVIRRALVQSILESSDAIKRLAQAIPSNMKPGDALMVAATLLEKSAIELSVSGKSDINRSTIN